MSSVHIDNCFPLGGKIFNYKTRRYSLDSLIPKKNLLRPINRLCKSESDLLEALKRPEVNGFNHPRSEIKSPKNVLSADVNLKLNNLETVRIPIIGYEIMEERERFTVYKLRVENSSSKDCWLVLRRYTDFIRLNNKLKAYYRNINLTLPRKKLFGDNFSNEFLENRKQGLQIFINTIMSSELLRSRDIVREFFCLDEPPTYSDNMEECKSIFEAQEETISHLKFQLETKNNAILQLQQTLLTEMKEKEIIKKIMESRKSCSACWKNIGFLKDGQ